MKTKKIRYAVVGLGHIAQIAVLPAFVHAKNSELTALVSGDTKKLKALGKQYKVKNLFTYDQYEDLLRSGTIDAVYIAVPNHLHRDFTVRAAEAGVHVLCEKPMAVTEEECLEMIEACRLSKVKLMVAYRLHFEEANLKAIEHARSGKIGEPRIFNSVFSFPVNERNYRAQGENRGGGPLYDIGIYCINAARYLFQSEPTEVLATGTFLKKRKIETEHETVSAILRFPEDRIATFTCSYGVAATGFFELIGTKGDLCLDEAYDYYGEKTLDLTVGENTKSKEFGKRDQFAPELIYFSDCIRKDKTPEPSGMEGFLDIRIIRSILESIDSGRHVFIQAPAKQTRPSLRQEIHRPPVRKPKLVRVQDPSEEAA